MNPIDMYKYGNGYIITLFQVGTEPKIKEEINISPVITLKPDVNIQYVSQFDEWWLTI